MPFKILKVGCWLFACWTFFCISCKSEKLLFSISRVERNSKEGDGNINNFESGWSYWASAFATLMFLPGL